MQTTTHRHHYSQQAAQTTITGQSPQNPNGSPSIAATATAIIQPNMPAKQGSCIAIQLAGATAPTIGVLHATPAAQWLQPLNQSAPVHLTHGYKLIGVVTQILHGL